MSLLELFAHHCASGDIKAVEIMLKNKSLDPSASDNLAIRWAAACGHIAVVKRLLQDERVDPSACDNEAIRISAEKGYLAVVDRLLQDKRVDPAAKENDALRWVAMNGHLAVIERLLQDARVDPSARGNFAIRMAVYEGNFKVVDRLLEDKRTRFGTMLEEYPLIKIYCEYRKRFTEICIALQDLELPAWITMMILKASKPWTTLAIHKRWKLVCAVKHFHKMQIT